MRIDRSGYPRRLSALIGAAMTPLILLSLAACSVESGTGEDTGTSTTATVRVTEGSVRPVLTLPGVVESSTVIEIASPLAGRLAGRGAEQRDLQVIGAAGAERVVLSESFGALAPLVRQGQRVAQGQPLARGRFEAFNLKVEVPPADLVRFRTAPTTVRAQITGGGRPFDCPLLSTFPTADESGKAQLNCAVPTDEPVVSNMVGVVAVRFQDREHVATLPPAAIAGSVDSGEVFVKTSSGLSRRQVSLGVSDGARVEVKSGVKVGDVVVMPNPGLLNENE